MATSVFSFISARNEFLFAKSFIISDVSQSTLPMALPFFFVLVQRVRSPERRSGEGPT